MVVVTPDDGIPRARSHPCSIFLAGPTPRDHTPVPSWRPEALALLRDDLRFEGSVFVPEGETWQDNYIGQVEWEYQCLEIATAIVFWVPRDLRTMPAFTTNVEFGLWVREERCFYGRPPGAPKTSYLDWLYKKFHDRLPRPNLTDVLDDAVLWAQWMRTKRTRWGQHVQEVYEAREGPPEPTNGVKAPAYPGQGQSLGRLCYELKIAKPHLTWWQVGAKFKLNNQQACSHAWKYAKRHNLPWAKASTYGRERAD